MDDETLANLGMLVFFFLTGVAFDWLLGFPILQFVMTLSRGL